ncbi:MAG TPA: DinB family protein [Gemmatimonadales bacterium]
MTDAVPRPTPTEYPPFYEGYVDQVPDWADPIVFMQEQVEALPVLFRGVSGSKAEFRYAPGKWSVKEVLGHLCDTERVFGYRLLRIARGDPAPLAGFDENAYVPAGKFGARPLASLLAEWVAVRQATLALVHSLPHEAWERQGTANGNAISARALLYITPGHVQHHLEVLRTRYGVGGT